MEISLWMQTIISGLTQGSLLALLAIGFNIIYNVAAMPNFAQAEFATIGAFLIFYITRSYNIPLPLVIILVVFLAAAIGVVFQKLVLYPARHLPHMHSVLITVGGMYMLQGAVLMIWGTDPIMSQSFSGPNPIEFLGSRIPTQSIWVIGLALLMTAFLYLFLSRTILGKALRSVAEKRDIAGIVGINVNVMDSFAWALAASVGAIGGAFIAPLYPFEYQSGLMVLTMVFSSVIIGGIGNVLGGFLGGMVIGMLLAVGAALFAPLKEIAVFIILLIILRFRPQGLLAGKNL